MTDIQKQCLLAFLGLYPHREIDGIWGPKSRSAMERFEELYPVKTLTEAVGEWKEVNFWQSVRHWNREEFRCRCGGKYCDGFPAEPDETLVRLLDDVREDFGSAGIPSSGLRCQTHNANVGGAAASRHMAGKAMDFTVRGRSAAEVLAYVQTQPEVRYCYAIDENYVHMDIE